MALAMTKDWQETAIEPGHEYVKDYEPTTSRTVVTDEVAQKWSDDQNKREQEQLEFSNKSAAGVLKNGAKGFEKDNKEDTDGVNARMNLMDLAMETAEMNRRNMMQQVQINLNGQNYDVTRQDLVDFAAFRRAGLQEELTAAIESGAPPAEISAIETQIEQTDRLEDIAKDDSLSEDERAQQVQAVIDADPGLADEMAAWMDQKGIKPSAEAAVAPPPQQLSIAEQVALSRQDDGPAPTTQGHFAGAATGAAEVEAEEEPEFDADDVAVSTPEAAPSIMEAIDNPAAAVSSGQQVAMIDVKSEPAPTQEQEFYSPTVNNTFGGMF